MPERERVEREREIEAREPVAGREPVAEERTPGHNGMSEYWTRFEAIQAQFIDEPRSAVRSAQKLVEEAVDRMMDGLRKTGSGDRADTEELRLAMRRYRDVLQQITGEGASETPSAGYAGTSPRGGEEIRTSETPSAGYAGTSPRGGEESYSTTPSPSASRRDLPTSGEEIRTSETPSPSASRRDLPTSGEESETRPAR